MMSSLCRRQDAALPVPKGNKPTPSGDRQLSGYNPEKCPRWLFVAGLIAAILTFCRKRPPRRLWLSCLSTRMAERSCRVQWSPFFALTGLVGKLSGRHQEVNRNYHECPRRFSGGSLNVVAANRRRTICRGSNVARLGFGRGRLECQHAEGSPILLPEGRT